MRRKRSVYAGFGGFSGTTTYVLRLINACPKEITPTDPTVALAERAEKGADVDVLRQMVQFMGQRLMEIDVKSRCGTDCRDQRWDTRAGALDLVIPKRRRGSHFPSYCRLSAMPTRRSRPSFTKPMSEALPTSR